MILENVMDYLKQDIEFFYVDIVDVKIMPNAITFFGESPLDITEHRYIRVKREDERTQVEIHTDSLELLDEVMAYLQNMKYDSVYLLLERDAEMDWISGHYFIEHQKDHSLKDYGVYGIIHSTDISGETCGIEVKKVNDNDVELISEMPNKEWLWLPQRIKKMNTEDMLIAKKGGEMAGYLIFSGGAEAYNDIGIVYVHPDFRKQKVGKALVNAFAQECEKRGEFAYYGTANSLASSILAQSLKIDLIREPNEMYKVITKTDSSVT